MASPQDRISRSARLDIGAMERGRRAEQVLAWARTHAGSLLALWLPTLLTALYYGLIAADLYQSEAKFILRSPTRAQISSLTNILQSTGITKAQDDLFAVHDFITSRDAITALEKHLNLREIFSRPEADFLSRYPGLIYGDSNEDFYRYCKTRIEVIYDSTTGISTLHVKAFRADDAQQIANLLLQESEALVNRLNERARTNAVSDAEKDVALAEAKVTEAQADLLSYRNRESMLDPKRTSVAIADTAAKMRAELLMTKARLAEIQQASPDSPLISGLKTRIATIESQLKRESASLAGSDVSMAPKIGEYEQLQLREKFAARALASSLVSLETARAEARRQQIFLDRVVSANQPDEADFPRRFENTLLVLITLGILFGIYKLLIAGIREHSQF